MQTTTSEVMTQVKVKKRVRKINLNVEAIGTLVVRALRVLVASKKLVDLGTLVVGGALSELVALGMLVRRSLKKIGCLE